ncbi:MAG: serine/threonine-protein kinase [Polyangiaceae bacterium]
MAYLSGSTQSIPAGTALGRYAVVDLVGMGGVAEVYEAVHLGLHKRVALKVLRKEVREHPEVRARFLREGKNASLIRHPNVVDIYDVGELNGLPFLVMEHLEGESLADLLDREGPLDEMRAAQLLLPVIAGVWAGHEKGVVHRDLKPENIFLARDGSRRTTPKILDFGVSKAMSAADAITLPDTAIGTPHYMSPEQARGERPVKPYMDQYAVGVTLFEMMTGRLPRQDLHGNELMQSIAFGTFESPRAWRPQMTPEMEAVILTAMAPTPDQRFPTLREMGLAMLPFASGRAQDHWRPEFTQVKPPSEQLARRATDPPPGFADDDQTVVDDLLAASHLAELRASDPRMPAQKPVFHSLWDDDEKTEFTEINRLLDQLPPDVREVMTRWRKVRAERLSTERKRAAAFANEVRNSGRPPPMPTSSAPPSSSAAAEFRSNRWVAVLGIATLVVAVVLTLLVVFSGP